MSGDARKVEMMTMKYESGGGHSGSFSGPGRSGWLFNGDLNNK